MLVLERGLKALAGKLKVRVHRQRGTWGTIIKEIEDAIAARLAERASSPKGTKALTSTAAARERKFLEECQNAATEFKFVKNIWRDHIAHGGGNYDQYDAKRALEHVGNFMRVLAVELKLKYRA
jgi:hypothetical protein